MVWPVWIKYVITAVCAVFSAVVPAAAAVAPIVHDKKISKHYQDKKIKKSDLKPGDHIYVPQCLNICSSSASSANGSSENGSSANGSSANGSSANAISHLIYHHGVYLDNDEVSDFGAVNETHPVIRQLADFLAKHQDSIYRREYVSTARTADQTVLLARSKCRSALEEAELNFCSYKPYDWQTNNCEHYATMLKTGKHWSGQVEKAGFWNASSAHKRYEKCNLQGAPGKSASAANSGMAGDAAVEPAIELVADEALLLNQTSHLI